MIVVENGVGVNMADFGFDIEDRGTIRLDSVSTSSSSSDKSSASPTVIKVVGILILIFQVLILIGHHPHPAGFDRGDLYRHLGRVKNVKRMKGREWREINS